MPNCLECPSTEIYAKGKCRRCYNRSYQKRWRHGFATGQFVDAAKFATCHKKAKHYAKGLCRKCYDKEVMKEWKREYNAKRYKDRKLNKTEPKVQGRVTHLISQEDAPLAKEEPFKFLPPEVVCELSDEDFTEYQQRQSDWVKAHPPEPKPIHPGNFWDSLTSKTIGDL